MIDQESVQSPTRSICAFITQSQRRRILLPSGAAYTASNSAPFTTRLIHSYCIERTGCHALGDRHHNIRKTSTIHQDSYKGASYVAVSLAGGSSSHGPRAGQHLLRRANLASKPGKPGKKASVRSGRQISAGTQLQLGCLALVCCQQALTSRGSATVHGMQLGRHMPLSFLSAAASCNIPLTLRVTRCGDAG